jgi:hypothetical protein
MLRLREENGFHFLFFFFITILEKDVFRNVATQNNQMHFLSSFSSLFFFLFAPTLEHGADLSVS